LARPTHGKIQTTIFFFFKALVILQSAKDMLCLGELISTVKNGGHAGQRDVLKHLLSKRLAQVPINYVILQGTWENHIIYRILFFCFNLSFI